MTETKPWYQSKIIWAQIISVLFVIAGIARFDIAGALGMDSEALLALVMTVVAVATAILRVNVTEEISSKPSNPA